MNKAMNIKKVTITAVISLIAVLISLGGEQLLAAPPEQPPGLEIAEPPGLEVAMAVQDAHTPSLMANPEVVGTAVGLNENGSPAILVFAKSDQVKGIPSSLEGFPVKVEVTGEFFALNSLPRASSTSESVTPSASVGSCPFGPDGRCNRPVPIGVSTGHPVITAGTIGCRVKKDIDGDGIQEVFALSNNHVYAHENMASIGDNVLQPGTFDGGLNPADAIGTLYDFKPIDFSGNCTNTIDAAIAHSSTDLLSNSTPPNGYGIPKSATARPRLNQRLDKYGRTSGSSNGGCLTYALNATINIGYESGVACFKKQIIVLSYTNECGLPGDSGSLFVTLRKNPVGLLFAADSLGLTVIANPIRDVLNYFGVTIDGE